MISLEEAHDYLGLRDSPTWPRTAHNLEMQLICYFKSSCRLREAWEQCSLHTPQPKSATSSSIHASRELVISILANSPLRLIMRNEFEYANLTPSCIYVATSRNVKGFEYILHYNGKLLSYINYLSVG